MKSLLKNLGLILMIIGAAILVGVFFTGSAAINDNGVLGGSAALIVIGLIVYIVLNKRIAALPVKKTPTKIAAPMIISIRPKFLSKLFMCVFY